MKTRLTEKYLKELGLRLKLIRTSMNLEQTTLAEIMRIGQSQVSKIELGQAAPTLYHLLTIKRIAEENETELENLSWEWLLEGKKVKPK